MPEADRQRRGNLCELCILKRERSGRFRPHKKVRFFSGGSEAEPSDFIELRGVRLKPIRGVRLHLWKIELHGAREMMGLRLWHQARASQCRNQENCRCGGCIPDPPAECQRVRRARPCEQRIETRDKKG